jgi:hypothetical protein
LSHLPFFSFLIFLIPWKVLQGVLLSYLFFSPIVLLPSSPQHTDLLGDPLAASFEGEALEAGNALEGDALEGEGLEGEDLGDLAGEVMGDLEGEVMGDLREELSEDEGDLRGDLSEGEGLPVLALGEEGFCL